MALNRKSSQPGTLTSPRFKHPEQSTADCRSAPRPKSEYRWALLRWRSGLLLGCQCSFSYAGYRSAINDYIDLMPVCFCLLIRSAQIGAFPLLAGDI
jgi:hypothetical protein|tara:strand:- start:372 stop:662 length:291 start_codon:yes stop_codon:yes gene_type:complete